MEKVMKLTDEERAIIDEIANMLVDESESDTIMDVIYTYAAFGMAAELSIGVFLPGTRLDMLKSIKKGFELSMQTLDEPDEE